ncbi:MAG: hypothetical protein GFH27_549313n45 [Chloroflexi bacterium AL-W]|nr:hypothetical protein [Chloroflexi bacterium AL-N1]NOK69468.1 hypothetical protein [Chloroflexi bacterium AL-N10]NOK77433.1 hypothetical protein [Chloroflexi bacterium AL-N5]NOK84284.1 hypothetical protein [Chloroflexi bacterium AL-W]NOK91550.1 hypothetical protein [Chloroflexi bacterium AL-N15]
MITRSAIPIIIALLFGSGMALLLMVLPRLPERVVVASEGMAFLTDGETPHLRNYFGFYGAETDGKKTFRWTTGEGSFVVRNGARLGDTLKLTLRICGCRLNDLPAPRLQLRVNGEMQVTTTATAQWGAWRQYELLITPQQVAYSPDLFIEILSDTTPHVDSNDPLGVAVAWVHVEAVSLQRAFSFPAAISFGLLTSVLLLVALWRGYTLQGMVLIAGLSLVLVATQGIFYRSHALPVDILALGLLISVGLAIMLSHSVWVAATIAVLLSALVLAIQTLGAWMLDDAFISFRYARNALHGYGFVFNPGERVEGYTNFLWTALFVPIQSVGIEPNSASMKLTLLIALGIATLTFVGARQLTDIGAALVALVLLVVCTPLVLYGARGSGMETALFTLLVLSGIVVYIWPSQSRRSVHLFTVGALFGLAAMTRPEGVLVGGVTGLHLLWSLWRDRRIAWQPVAALSVGFLLIFGPYYIWRFSYYGYPLPNTFYAKVGGTGAQAFRGLFYAADFAIAQAPLIAFALFGGIMTARRRAAHVGAVGFLVLLLSIYTLYIIAVGGDHFPYYRFFVPLVPPLVLLAAVGVAHFTRHLSPRLMISVLVVCAALGVTWQAPQLYASRTLNTDGQVWGENSVVEKNREIGLWLGAHTTSDTLIATGIAGALPFYSERPVLDALGLNDLHIAHLEVPTMGQGVAGSEKTDVAYILSQRPGYIPHNSAGVFRGDPTFESMYESMTLRGPEGRGIKLYRRVDLPVPVTAQRDTLDVLP